ncbi:MAG TPA: response regulator transcription factor, partial [Pyrinomonadaceae bacterium]|nr:response regulator transcription factor [Pyrinomonadaceae bacterium]
MRAGAVLIVEDEKHLADGLRYNLEAEGYEVETAGDGESALAMLLGGGRAFDAVVLDVMLPGADGFAVASALRGAGQFVPVLMLTARGRPEDVLRGFESGADDYLPKPFELSVLIARIKGLIRRREWFHLDRGGAPAAAHDGGESFSFGGRTIDFEAFELRVRGQTVRLTLMEASVLRYLIRHEGRVVSRKSLLEEVWDLRDDTSTRAIDNF